MLYIKNIKKHIKPDVDFTMVEPIHINMNNMNDVQNSERINPYFVEGEKSKPIYEALVEKYGKEETDKLYSDLQNGFLITQIIQLLLKNQKKELVIR